MRRLANKATCDMWIMRHKLRLRSKLACFEFNQEKVCSTRANLYTLSVETNPRAPISEGGKRESYHPYHTSISVFHKCEWRMSGRTKRRTVKRESKRLVDYRSACKENGRIFFLVISQRVVHCDRSASILIPSLPRTLAKQLSLRCK